MKLNDYKCILKTQCCLAPFGPSIFHYLFISSFIVHSFNKYLSGIHCISSTVPSTGDKVIKKHAKFLDPLGIYFLVEKTNKARDGLPEKVFMQRLEGCESEPCGQLEGECFKERSNHKGPVVRTCMVYWRNSKEYSDWRGVSMGESNRS